MNFRRRYPRKHPGPHSHRPCKGWLVGWNHADDRTRQERAAIERQKEGEAVTEGYSARNRPGLD